MFAMASGAAITEQRGTVAGRRESCCSAYHQAIELIGKRWTGAIVFVLLDGPLREMPADVREDAIVRAMLVVGNGLAGSGLTAEQEAMLIDEMRLAA